MTTTENIKADVITSDQAVFHINSTQLPLRCPLPEMSLWNQHPCVYLPIDENGKAKCPYCGCEYLLDSE